MTTDRAALLAAAEAAIPGPGMLASSLPQRAIIDAAIEAVEPLIRRAAGEDCALAIEALITGDDLLGRLLRLDTASAVVARQAIEAAAEKCREVVR